MVVTVIFIFEKRLILAAYSSSSPIRDKLKLFRSRRTLLCFQVSGLWDITISFNFASSLVRHFVCLTCLSTFQSYLISSFYSKTNRRTLILASAILANQKSAVKLNQSVRSAFTFFVGALNHRQIRKFRTGLSL